MIFAYICSMIVARDIAKQLTAMAKKMPVVALNGPRQSGKTTAAKQAFPSYEYRTLEDRDTRAYAEADPRKFLEEFSGGVILDEVQRMPDLFSYIQTIVDRDDKSGRFILTGSMNFLLLQNISQSLAGRVALMRLLPFSLSEIERTKVKITKPEDVIFRGCYPRLYSAKLDPHEWYPSYTESYVERDVRLIKNISDLGAFRRFLRLCAGRVGQLVNLTEMGSEVGVNYHTIRSWLGVLETSFTVFLMESHHKNYAKRMIKMPKLYFYDTGMACSLLGIQSPKQLETHYLRGALFENFVITEIMKTRYNQGKRAELYFWRDKRGNEIDCIIDDGTQLTPIEMKSSKTIASDFFKGLEYWNSLSKQDPQKSLLVYGGSEKQERTQATVIGWRDVAKYV